VPLTGAVVASTPSDVALQDARKAIEMFRQVKVDILGLVENMSAFHCPHCHQEIDIFSKGGGEYTARQFGIPFLGAINLDPEVRRRGDNGNPVALEGEASEHAKPFYDLARQVMERTREVRATAGESVIQIQ
jgi:ATP-binding protein involved in chromosome partitioning